MTETQSPRSLEDNRFLPKSFGFGNRLTILAISLVAVLAWVSVVQAQTSSKKIAKPGSAPSGVSIPDFSGFWGPGQRQGLQWEVADLPMRPWAREKFEAARPPFGPKATFDEINDPVQLYCDPTGIPRIYNYPWQLTFLQTHDTVYILYEFSRIWRSVAMNRDHPKDPDSTWLGDSIGRYEGDALVVDTVGFNDKTWLDHPGHPHSDALHLIERFRRIDPKHLEVQITVDDPKAYTRTFTGKRILEFSTSPMGETLCSMSENEAFKEQVMDPTTIPATK